MLQSSVTCGLWYTGFHWGNTTVSHDRSAEFYCNETELIWLHAVLSQWASERYRNRWYEAIVAIGLQLLLAGD